MSIAGEIFVSDVPSEPVNIPKHYRVCDHANEHFTVSGTANENDSVEHLIHVFNEKGEWLRKIDCSLNVPRGLDIDDANNLYVSDSGHHYTMKISLDNPSLSLCTSWNADWKFDYPYGLTVVKELETVFTCDKENGRVVATDLQLNMRYTLEGLSGPVDVAYNSDHLYSGHLYVANRKTIAVYWVGKELKESDAKPVEEFNSTLNNELTFKNVRGISIANGHIYVADKGEHVVVVMDLARNLVAKIGEGKLHNPTAVTVHNGNVYITSDAKDDKKATVHVYGLVRNE